MMIRMLGLLVLFLGISGCGDGSMPAATETPQVDHAQVEQEIEVSRDRGNAKYMRQQRGR